MEIGPNVRLCAVSIALDLSLGGALCWLAVWVARSPNSYATAIVLPLLACSLFVLRALFTLALACSPRTLRIDEAGLQVSLPGRNGLVRWDDIEQVDVFRTKASLARHSLNIRLKKGTQNPLRGMLAGLYASGPQVIAEAVNAPMLPLHGLLVELVKPGEARAKLRRPGWARERLAEIERGGNP